MWSPTTKTTAISSSSETSDNKNKENIEEDCSCSSGGRQQTDLEKDTSHNSSSVVCTHDIKHLQLLNNLEINSKLQQQQQQQQETTSLGGNLLKSDSNSSFVEDSEKFNNKKQEDKKEIELSGGYCESVDSGFISGPQNISNHFYDNSDKIITESEQPENQSLKKEGAIGGGICSSSSSSHSSTNITKYNILPNEKIHQQQLRKKETTAILDSGCIEEEIEEENFDDYEEQYEDKNHPTFNNNNNNNTTSTNTSNINTNSNTDKGILFEQEEQININSHSSSNSSCSNSSSRNPQVAQLELASNKTQINNNIAIASNSNSSNNNKNINPNNTTTNTKETTPMIFKQNVDAGMSEWFCNLNLQSDAPNINGMNNLDINNESKPNTSGVDLQRPPQQTSSCSQTQSQPHPQQQITAFTPGLAITPTNAWEQFFQQNDDGDTPLHLAVICGRTDVIVALLRTAPHPCLLNIQNDDAQTPLHLAALTSRPTIIRMLLLAGAEPKARDRDGNTALHLACMNSEIQCVRSLIENFTGSEIVEAHRQFGHLSNDKSISSLNFARLPSDLEIRNYNGEKCVHLVAQNGNIDILRLLVLHGADINAREGRSGLTPLHIAIECCNEKLANFLLDECEKLNVETETYAGLTAYQVAYMLNKSQLQTMLENYGAEPLTPPDSDYDSSDMEDLDELYDRFGDPGYFIGYSGGNPMTVA